MGVLLMVFGLGWLLRVAGAIEMGWESLLSVVLIVLGVGMAITARARTGGILMVLGIFLTISLATTSSVGEIGELSLRQHLTPTTLTELEDEYRLIGGSFRLDLRQYPFPAGETTVDVNIGGGEIRVVIPEGVAVDVDAELGGGEIRLLDNEQVDGGGITDTYTDSNYEDAERRLRLNLSGGGGQIRVSRSTVHAPTEATAPPPDAGDANASS